MQGRWRRKTQEQTKPKNKTRGSSEKQGIVGLFCGPRQQATANEMESDPCACARLHDGLLGFLGFCRFSGTVRVRHVTNQSHEWAFFGVLLLLLLLRASLTWRED
ncbi:hypothetical protein M440DRAFT_1247252 [Trichoderma longibrachiatum ATCC 18648]|uniref:Uncharacterized protein n=1 Tax=Trichoderma longibrachiatum ATCC 18648 TaxID=983965 RepID=A0A2T4C3M4_TRILO|nr:hypothetical protein M440DRAFT_1247252 [Trichoderma longibrachiatum ATCC 18648]